MDFTEGDDIVIKGRSYGTVVGIDGDLVTVLTHTDAIVHVQKKDVLGVLPRLP